MVSGDKMQIFVFLLVLAACTAKSVPANEGPRRAVVQIRGAEINGKIAMEQASPSSPVKIRGTVYGLEAGLHGMHVHENKQLGSACQLVGSHFNPTGANHGGPRDPLRHVGDLGNVKTVSSSPASRTDINVISQLMSLYENSENSVMHRAVVIHAGADDLGRGGNPESLKNGNAGAHVACGLIEPVEIDSESEEERDESRKGEQKHSETHKKAESDKENELSSRMSRISKDVTSNPSHVPSNLNVEGIERPDLSHHDGFELKTPTPTHKVWKVGKVYEYDYSGFISTGIMGIGPKISGGSITGRLTIQPVDEHTINIALRNVKGKMFNEDVMEEYIKADPGEPVQIMDKKQLEKPIQVKIINGKIETVLISKEEPLWTVNFKRALAAQIQLQLDGSSGVFHKSALDTYYAENAAYHVMEGCASGDCRTWYHISRVPQSQIRSNPKILAMPELCENQPIYEIVKNRDFDKCRTLPVFNYISAPGLQCDIASGAGCQNAHAHVDMVKIVGCKMDENTFVVQRIKVMDRLTTKPFGYETEAIEALSIQHLHLVNIKSSRSAAEDSLSVPDDAQAFKTLAYSYEEQNAKQGPKMSQPTLRSHNIPLVMDVEDKVAAKEAERLLMEIVRELESAQFYQDPSGKFVADKMDMLRKALSNLDYTQLVSFAAKYATPDDQSSTINQVVVDAMVNAGTNPSLMLVRDWILKGRLQGEQAVQAVAMLPATIKTPTKELLANLMDLLESSAVTKDQQLKFATALSLSRIVYQACVNTTASSNMFPKLVMGDFCSVNDAIVTRRLVPWLRQQLKSADSDIERIAMLAALGNIGHEIIIPSILPHISSCEPGSSEEAEWYERHRRSIDSDSDEEQLITKKEWRKKWLAYKKKHSKDDLTVDELLHRFEEELKEEQENKGAKKSDKSEKKSDKKTAKKELKEEKKSDKEDDKESKQKKKASKKSSKQRKSKQGSEQEDSKKDMKNKKKEDKEEEESKKDMKDRKKEEKQEKKEMKAYEKSKAKQQELEEDYETEIETEDETEAETEWDEDIDEEEEDDEEQQYSTEGIEDQAACNILRVKAIYALSTMAVDKKDVVAKILMPIYFNKVEETEVRLAALSLLFVSNPPVAFWERVALSTWTEPNDQVAHYIYTTIASLVANKDPKRREITVRAESVLPMMKPMRWMSFVSSNYLKAGYQEKTRLGYLTKTVNFPGHESFVPSNHYNSIYLTAGPWFARLADISINSKQPEKLLDKILGKPTLRSKSNKDQSAHMHPELANIQKELQIEARAAGKPEIFIYVNLLDNYQRFLSITPQSVEKMMEKLMRSSAQRGNKADLSLNRHKVMPLVDAFVRIPSAMGLAYSSIAQIRLLTSIKSKAQASMDMKSMKSVVAQLEGTIQSVMNLEMASKITVEMPWTRSYPTSGVQVEMSLALPGKFSLAADVNKGKIETSWQFMGDNLRLLRHAVVPFTAIRKLGDYTPSLLLKDAKPISILSSPAKNDQSIGQKALGLNMVWSVRGDVQAMKTPTAYDQDWLGSLLFSALPSTLRFQERNLYLDNAQSETKIIKARVSIAAKDADDIKMDEEQLSEDDQEHQIRSLKKLFSDSKKMSTSDMDDKADQEWTQRNFKRLFHTMSEPSGYSIDASIELSSGTKSRRYGTSLSYGVGDQGLSHRGQLTMQKRLMDGEIEDDEDNFVLCVDVDARSPKPSVVRREEFPRDDLSRISTVKINFGKSCTDDRKITITTKMARSEEEVPSTVHSKWQERECSKQELFGRGVSAECISTRRLAAILNKGVITIDYNQMPSIVRNVTTKISNMFGHWMNAHMSDNQVDVSNTVNQIRIETVYYPIIGSMDLRVFKPNSNTFYHGIDIHPVAEAVLPFNPRLTAFRAIYGGPGLCMVDRDSVTTYDGLTYNASIAGCDQVVTKDCSGRYNMAVLTREENNKKIVTVYLNKEKIEINAAASKVKINGNERMLADMKKPMAVRDADDDVLALIRKTSDGFIELESPSHAIRVTVNKEELIVLNSPIHHGRLCGLCGTQTGNKETDLTGPKKCSLPDDLMSVAYEMKQPKECKSSQTPGERDVLRKLQHQCEKEKSMKVFGVTDARPIMPKFQQKALSMRIRSAAQDCEISRNRMIHRGRKRCFSIESALKCTPGCKPTAIEPVKLAFHCLEAGPLSDELKEEMAIRPLDELADKDVSTMATLRIPTGCAPDANQEDMSAPMMNRHQ